MIVRFSSFSVSVCMHSNVFHQAVDKVLYQLETHTHTHAEYIEQSSKFL